MFNRRDLLKFFGAGSIIVLNSDMSIALQTVEGLIIHAHPMREVSAETLFQACQSHIALWGDKSGLIAELLSRVQRVTNPRCYVLMKL